MGQIETFYSERLFRQRLYVERRCSQKIKEFEKAAEVLYYNTDADHVLYAIKYFDENSNLKEVKFYELPMTNEEFNLYVARQVRVQVYALHRLR